MRDVQGERDIRNIPIDRVGVRNVYYPIFVKDPSRGENGCHEQSTVASVSMSVLLPHEYRGTHMSRFIETLEEYHGRISPAPLQAITRRLRERLGASESTLRFDFPASVPPFHTLRALCATRSLLRHHRAGIYSPVRTLI